MLHVIRQQLRPAFSILCVLTLFTGLFYPGVITVVAQVLFPFQAQGSLLKEGTVVAGSALIGQSFSDNSHFWGRPSATLPVPYNAASSAGSNFSPTNPAFFDFLGQQAARLQQAHGSGPVPVELATASGSGLDPHISPAAAFYQVSRVARAAGLDEQVVRDLVRKHTEARQFGILGEPRVNVLALNMALDGLKRQGQLQTPTR